MSDRDYEYGKNEEYEFEQTRADQNKVKMGIAGGMAGAIITGLKWGYKMYQEHKEQEELNTKREELNTKRRALVADLNEYEDKFFSFRYEDKKANLRRQIKEIDKKLQG